MEIVRNLVLIMVAIIGGAWLAGYVFYISVGYCLKKNAMGIVFNQRSNSERVRFVRLESLTNQQRFGQDGGSGKIEFVNTDDLNAEVRKYSPRELVNRN